MSPSRFSAGITSGSPADESSSANVASISCGSYGTSGCRSAAASISSLSIPSYVGLTVYFGPPKTFAPVRSAWRNANSATARQIAPLDPLGAVRDLVVALAFAPLLRAVGVADRHAHDRDRRVDAAERRRRPGSGGRCARSPCRRSPRAGSGSASRRRRAPRASPSRPSGRARARGSRRPPRGRPRSPSRGGSRARGRSAANSSSTPITSGASTRRASSSSSWPVWSPSRTTIVFSSRIGGQCSDRRSGRTDGDAWRLDAHEGGRARSATSTSTGREIRDAAKVERVEKLAIPPAWKDVWISPRPKREAPGDRLRQGGPEAVPLPPRFPRRAGAGEVRQAHPLRREAARPARDDGRASRQGRARPRARLRGRAAADQRAAGSASARSATRASRGTYGITTLTKRHVGGARQSRHAQLPRQARDPGPDDDRRRRARRGDPRAARACRRAPRLPLRMGGRRSTRSRASG